VLPNLLLTTKSFGVGRSNARLHPRAYPTVSTVADTLRDTLRDTAWSDSSVASHTDSRCRRPIRTPSEVVTNACSMLRVFKYSGISPARTFGLKVTGAASITSSIRVAGSPVSASRLTIPSTTRSRSTTTTGPRPSPPARARTSPSLSSIRHVWTSRFATSATRGMWASRPSRGRSAANQSAFPA
jgi:hypothetical protein